MYCFLVPPFEILVVGRVILGIAVGGATTVVPVYPAKLARSRYAARWPTGTS
ncbi:MFS transporter [Gryllotalpicola ginsengisoli]|uniref:MFS transporter n=1 Tax=Gryllotalpicola ginsengisoli TaxID=444608 RepID=UPI003898F6ED